MLFAATQNLKINTPILLKNYQKKRKFSVIKYLIGPFFAGPNLTPALLTPEAEN